MTGILLQDIVVTITALGCAAFVLGRVIGLVRPLRRSGCDKCASPGCGETSPDVAKRDTHPLVVIRR